MIWLYALVALLAFALGLTLRDLALVLTGGRYGGTIDLSAKAARGELDLDWGDARRVRTEPNLFEVSTSSGGTIVPDALSELEQQRWAMRRAALNRALDQERLRQSLRA